ncbi:uncharacterized protein [Pagrus major]|uniref:uncharacterized protein isoform X2 n=1 Tax=Pagrus major TaxID=143350 RepID=UPI003CC85676
MSMRKTTRIIKKKKYPDCVQGPVYPSPPKKYQKGSSTAPLKGRNNPSPPKKRQKGNTAVSKGPVPQQPSTDNPYSMDLFAREKAESSIDLPESCSDLPESSMEMSKSWNPPADDVNDDDDDDDITRLSSVSTPTLKTVLTAPKYTSTPGHQNTSVCSRRRRSGTQVNTSGNTPRVHTAARTPEGCDTRSPICTPVRTPQDVSGRLSKIAKAIIAGKTSNKTPRRASVPKNVQTPKARKRVYPMTEKKFQMVVVETLMEILEELKALNSNESEPETGRLPMKDMETFELMSKEIEGNADIRKSMIAKLSHIGGKDIKTCTNKIMDRLFMNTIMTRFNMLGGGKQKKRAFTQTAFYSVVTAVRKSFKDATDDRIASAMGLHFKQAPARSGGGGYKPSV